MDKNFETVTRYIMTCECGAKKTVKDQPSNYEEYICKNCLEELKEPKLEDYSEFYDFIVSLENWIYTTGKKITYDMSNIKEDVFKSYGVEGDKAEKAWSIANNRERSSGYTNVIAMFSDLVDLIKD